ncbi:uncharacterized protein RAG0_05632 [Rhynchosporium agropyri]|uniref:Uncharacterized protein n=1 Tax=Rhynchosporium agropyri TaxID=914238 RepID=A0A1E1KDW7_9HELO|nr:uncharacterized protein RAG0_05632 [Rhynchosporium agropyri]
MLLVQPLNALSDESEILPDHVDTQSLMMIVLPPLPISRWWDTYRKWRWVSLRAGPQPEGYRHVSDTLQELYIFPGLCLPHPEQKSMECNTIWANIFIVTGIKDSDRIAFDIGSEVVDIFSF